MTGFNLGARGQRQAPVEIVGEESNMGANKKQTLFMAIAGMAAQGAKSLPRI
jgi:hypothetical protein